MKILIVGGVAGGATAAARIRRNTEKAEIILFEKGGYISYANCGLPYYIGGVITDRERLFVQTTPAAFARRFNIDVRTGHEVTALDPNAKKVTVRSRNGRTYTETFDKLLLSPGASPVRPPLPGIDSNGIFTLRNVDDTDKIKAFMQSHAVRKAVVVGGGFIGLEMAENLVHAGARVSVIDLADQVMAPIDYSMAALVHERHGHPQPDAVPEAEHPVEYHLVQFGPDGRVVRAAHDKAFFNAPGFAKMAVPHDLILHAVVLGIDAGSFRKALQHRRPHRS